MGERMWPKLRALTMTLTLLSCVGDAGEDGGGAVGGVVVDEDVFEEIVGVGLHDLAHAEVEGLDVVFLVVGVGDDADCLQK